MIRVLHLFHEYLNTTENWAYRLINCLKNCKVYVGSEVFLKNNFYSGNFNYFIFPLADLAYDIKKNTKVNTPVYFFKKVLFRLNTLLFKNYKQYLFSQSKAEKIQIIHSHFSFVGYEYLNLGKKLKVPHIVSFYGFDYEWLPINYPEWQERYKKLFKEADLFICEGTVGAKTLEGAGCEAKKIRVVNLGVNPEKIFYYHREKQVNKLNLLQVADFTEKKGHVYCIEAFKKALKDCPDMTLTLVGKDLDGTKKGLYKTLLGGNGTFRDKIIIIDRVDFDSLHQFMHNYDVFIHPSCYTEKKDCEGGAPVVLLDAQATGMPVISTKHCDIPDEVIHEKTGLLSDERNVDQLVKSIERFYRMDQQEYDFFSKNARKHIEQHYDIKKNALMLEKVYEEALHMADRNDEIKQNSIDELLKSNKNSGALV